MKGIRRKSAGARGNALIDALVVNVQLTPEDYVQAHRLHRLRSSWAGRHAAALIIVSALVCGVVLVFLLRDIWALHITIVVLGAGFLIDRLWVTRQARRQFRKLGHLQRPFSLEFSDYGLRSGGQASYAWSDIPRWSQGELLYLIYASDGTYHPVPKRFMPDATVLGEVLRDKVGAAS